jgi:hypothetical protein
MSEKGPKPDHCTARLFALDERTSGAQTQGAFSTEGGPYAARFSCMIGVQQQGQFDDEEF